MDRIDDTELFIAFQRGEAVADKYIFDRYFRALCFFAEKLTFHSIIEAEDIVAETFIKMFQKRSDFANLANIRSFLYLATRNACINHYKTQQRHKKANSLIALQSDEISLENALEDELIRARILQEIYEEMEALPGRCKEIFKLIFLKGLTTDQIAEQLGISPQTVRTQKARAIQLLRVQLLKKGIPALALLLFAAIPGRL